MPEPTTDGSTKARLPWDRTEGEPAKAYSHFVKYRDSGRERTVYAVADEVKKARGYLYQLSRRWNWIRRAEAWDHEQDRVFAQKMADRRRKSAEMGLAVIGAARAKLVERLSTLDVTKLTPADWIRWFEVLTKLERDLMGQPSTIVGHTGSDGGPITALVGEMSDEERKQYLVKLVAEAQSRTGLGSGSDADEEEDGPTDPPTEESGEASGP